MDKTHMLTLSLSSPWAPMAHMRTMDYLVNLVGYLVTYMSLLPYMTPWAAMATMRTRKHGAHGTMLSCGSDGGELVHVAPITCFAVLRCVQLDRVDVHAVLAAIAFFIDQISLDDHTRRGETAIAVANALPFTKHCGSHGINLSHISAPLLTSFFSTMCTMETIGFSASKSKP